YKNERCDHDGKEAEQIENAELMRQACNTDFAGLNFGHEKVRWFPVVVVIDKFIPARASERCRQLDAKVAEQAEQIAAPSRGYCSSPKGVFQHQIPTDDPGKNFAQRGITVGVSGAGNRNG